MKKFYDKLAGGCLIVGIIGFWLMWFLFYITVNPPPLP
jgi:hypothetical protein